MPPARGRRRRQQRTLLLLQKDGSAAGASRKVSGIASAFLLGLIAQMGGIYGSGRRFSFGGEPLSEHCVQYSLANVGRGGCDDVESMTKRVILPT